MADSIQDASHVLQTMPDKADIGTVDVAVDSPVRRSTRPRTGRKSLNVEEMALAAGIPDDNVPTRKIASVSRNLPVKRRGISKRTAGMRMSLLEVEDDGVEESAPGSIPAANATSAMSRRSSAGTKRKTASEKAPAPLKRPRVSKVAKGILAALPVSNNATETGPPYGYLSFSANIITY